MQIYEKYLNIRLFQIKVLPLRHEYDTLTYRITGTTVGNKGVTTVYVSITHYILEASY
jgi:hypothetical protein